MEILHYNIDMTPESSWQIVSAGAFAKDNLLYLQEAGHFISGVNYYTVRKDLDSYLVKLTLAGQGILEYGGETYQLPSGRFFWIDCCDPQHYYTDPAVGHWDVLWFHFYGATASAYYQAFLQQTHGQAAASLPVDSPVSAQMGTLLSLAGTDGELVRDLDASALLTTILCGLIHGAAQQRIQPVPATLQQVRQYLHQQYAQKLTLDTLSARYNISKYHLQRSFQHYFGQSPGEYLTQLRLTRAKELLRATCRYRRSPTASAWTIPATLSIPSAPTRAQRRANIERAGRCLTQTHRSQSGKSIFDPSLPASSNIIVRQSSQRSASSPRHTAGLRP